MKTTLILFSRPRFSLFAWVVRLFQGWTPYSHIAICFYSDDVEDYVVFESSYGIVHSMSFTEWLEKNVLVKSVSLDVNPHWCDLYMKKAHSFLGKPYGFLALIPAGLKLLGFKLPFKGDGTKSMTCSEYICRVINNRLPFEESDFVSPKDLYRVLVC